MSNARKLADNLPAEGQLGNRNVIINGEFAISQRGSSFTNIGSAGTYDDTYTIDRFLISQGVSAGRCTVTQESDTPTGFSNSLKIATTTADTSVAAGEYHRLQTKFEGQNLQRFAKGTTGAKEFTLSFYCKANAAATYVVELVDNDNSRSVSKTFSVTTDWTRVIITFPADTTGAFTNDANLSMEVNWWMHAGSTYSSGTLQTTWGAIVAANRAAGINSIFDSTSRTFFITGCQLEVGSQASPFEHEQHSVTLAKCQRYTFVHQTDSDYDWAALSGYCNTTTNALSFYQFPVRMRASPTLTTSGSFQILDGFTSYTVSSSSLSQSSPLSARVDIASSGLTVGRHIAVRNLGDSGAKLIFSAEI